MIFKNGVSSIETVLNIALAIYPLFNDFFWQKIFVQAVKLLFESWTKNYPRWQTRL